MATNVRQHYLPASYLAQFASDPSKGRDACVLRLGAQGAFVPTTCASQCAKRYFYSKDTAREADEWEELEHDWSSLVADIRAANESGNLAARLFQQLTTLHLRNAAFEHNADDQDGERLDTLKTARRELWRLVCGNPDATGLFALPPTWRAHLINLDKPAFITSDNPVVMFAHNEAQAYSCFGAPVTPTNWAIVYDVAKWGLFPEGNVDGDGDLAWSLLNQVQCASSVHSIYAPDTFGGSELAKYVQMFSKRIGGRSYGSGHAAFVMLNFPDHRMFPTAGRS